MKPREPLAWEELQELRASEQQAWEWGPTKPREPRASEEQWAWEQLTVEQQAWGQLVWEPLASRRALQVLQWSFVEEQQALVRQALALEQQALVRQAWASNSGFH